MKKILLAVLATVVATSAVATTTQFDDWRLVNTVDPVSNTSSPYIYTNSVEGSSKYGNGTREGVGCYGLFINTTGVVIDRTYNSSAISIKTRFGGESKASSSLWNTNETRANAFLNFSQYISFLGNKNVWNSQSIFNKVFQRRVDESVRDNPHHWIKVPAYGEADVNYKFSDKGFNDAINKLAGLCSSKKLSVW